MSDYSPAPSPNAFDELEDLLYDADPAPDLADELAQNAYHSPLLYAQDYEPGYEMQEYFSDWEYYSDDYYDDDPKILKKNPIDGGSPKQPIQAAARGKKRKAADLESDNAIVKERRYLKDCMKGTIWATEVPMRNNVYLFGQDEKVALLKDWRERFGNASPRKLSHATANNTQKTSGDESWANDLSLADMGLLSARGKEMDAEEADDEDDVADEAGDGDEEAATANGPALNLDDIELDEDAYEMLMAAAAQAAADGSLGDLDPQQAAVLRQLTQRAPRAQSPTAPELIQHNSDVDTEALPVQQPGKRRKKNPLTRANGPLPSPPASTGTISQPQVPSPTQKSTTPALPKGNSRKRKASTPPPESADAGNVAGDGSGAARAGTGRVTRSGKR